MIKNVFLLQFVIPKYYPVKQYYNRLGKERIDRTKESVPFPIRCCVLIQAKFKKLRPQCI